MGTDGGTDGSFQNRQVQAYIPAFQIFQMFFTNFEKMMISDSYICSTYRNKFKGNHLFLCSIRNTHGHLLQQEVATSSLGKPSRSTHI